MNNDVTNLIEKHLIAMFNRINKINSSDYTLEEKVEFAKILECVSNSLRNLIECNKNNVS